MKKIILLLCFFTMSIFAYSDMIDELDIQKILQQGYKIELSSRDTVVVSKKNAIVSQIVFTKFRDEVDRDRKSTRLNSSHANISYAVFCLKKKTKKLYC